MSELQKIFQEPKKEKEHQEDSIQSCIKLNQKNNSTFLGKIWSLKRRLIILVILVSSLLLFYQWQELREYTNLFNNSQNNKQNHISSFDEFQNDRSIDREGKGEAGNLMKTVVDKIFMNKGFQIEARTVSAKHGGYMSDATFKGRFSFSPYSGHFHTKGVASTGDIYSDEEDIVVAEIFPDTPAEKAGVKYKDQIIAIDNKKLRNALDLINHIQSKENIAVSLRIRRDNKEITLLVTPKKIYDEKIGIGIRFWEMKDHINNEVIIYENKIYDKRGPKFIERNYDTSKFDSPCLDEILQWDNPMYYINYLKFYKNPEIIEITESEIRITFDVDLSYFIGADKSNKETSQIYGEISLDKNNLNPIQEKLEIISGNYERDVTIDFINFDEVTEIMPPNPDDVIFFW